MAAVYRVYDTRLRVECAIKVMAPEFSAKGDLRKRFESEAATMARLRHSSIAAVFDVGDDDGSPYLVMELIAGGSLNDHLELHGPLPPKLAAEVSIAVLTALQLAHDNGVIHRDIKPHNVLLARDGTAKVTDFGIARVQADDVASMTRTGSIMGTWAYMAPEQRAGARGLDGRADIYSTGAMLVDLLTGVAPADVFMCELHKDMLAGVPEALRPIVERAVRYVSTERYATADDMAQALREALPALPEVPATYPKLGTIAVPTVPMGAMAPPGPDGAAGIPNRNNAKGAARGTMAPGDFTEFEPSQSPDGTLPPSALEHVPQGLEDTGPPTGVPANGRSRLVIALATGIALTVGAVAWSFRGDPNAAGSSQASPSAPLAVTVGATAPPAPPVPKAEPPPSELPKAEPIPSTAPAARSVPQAAMATSTSKETAPKSAMPPIQPVVQPPVPAAAPAAPAVAVAPAPTAAPSGSGTVRLTGDADGVTFIGNGGRFSAGEVPSGTYSIEASFAGGAPAPAGKVTIPAGGTVTVKCMSEFARCK